jgi:hypothetical protein
MAKLTLGGIVMGLLLTATPASAAPFALNTVRVAYLFPDLATIEQGPVDITAPDAITFALTAPGSFGEVDLLVLDSEIRVIANVNSGFAAATFHGFRITDVNNTIPPFTAVTGPPSVVTFDDDNIFINLADVNILRNDSLSFEVTAADPPGAVPEPSILLLTALGIPWLTRGRRR